MRLKRLNISTRNCVPIRSVIFVFFTTQKSTDGVARSVEGVARLLPKVPGSGIGKRGGIDPVHAALAECVRDAGIRIADEVGALLAFVGAAGVVG